MTANAVDLSEMISQDEVLQTIGEIVERDQQITMKFARERKTYKVIIIKNAGTDVMNGKYIINGTNNGAVMFVKKKEPVLKIIRSHINEAKDEAMWVIRNGDRDYFKVSTSAKDSLPPECGWKVVDPYGKWPAPGLQYYDVDAVTPNPFISDEHNDEVKEISNRESKAVFVTRAGTKLFRGKYLYSKITEKGYSIFEHIENEQITIQQNEDEEHHLINWEFRYKQQVYYYTFNNNNFPPSTGWSKTKLGSLPTPSVRIDNIYQDVAKDDEKKRIIFVEQAGMGYFNGKYSYSTITRRTYPLFEHIENEYIIIQQNQEKKRWEFKFSFSDKIYYYANSDAKFPPSSGWQTTSLGIAPMPVVIMNVNLFNEMNIFKVQERDKMFQSNLYRVLFVSNTGFESMDGQYLQNDDDMFIYNNFEDNTSSIRKGKELWQFIRNSDVVFVCQSKGKFPPTSGWKQCKLSIYDTRDTLQRQTVGDVYFDIFQVNRSKLSVWRSPWEMMQKEIKQGVDDEYSIIGINGINVSSVNEINMMAINATILQSDEKETELCVSACKNTTATSAIIVTKAQPNEINGLYLLSYDIETDSVTYIHKRQKARIEKTNHGWVLKRQKTQSCNAVYNVACVDTFVPPQSGWNSANLSNTANDIRLEYGAPKQIIPRPI